MTTIDTSTEAVERLLENVTPGPWQAETWEDYETEYGFEQLLITSESGISVVEGCGCCGSPKGENVRDASFIAAARDLIPALLKERDEALAKLAVAVEALEKIAEGWTAAADDDTGELVEVRMSEDEMGETARAALAQIKGDE